MHLLTLLSLGALQGLSATQIPLRPPTVDTDLNPDPLALWHDLSASLSHNIVPATVPVNTLLYHGRVDDQLPAVPEWTSTDPEHSWPFCSAPPTNDSIAGCWQLTLVTSRPLKVLYFDGSSAAKIPEGGPTDAQDLLAWGKADPERWADERDRIDDLCAWGGEFGIDGYLRMEMDFEIMLCDFSSHGGVELVSADYLAAWHNQFSPPLNRKNAHADAHTALYPQAPLGDPVANLEGFPVFDVLRFETVHAGSWHDRYPGDTRIVLDLTRLVSFYDTSLAPSLVQSRAGQQRWDHRLHDISASDLVAVRTRLAAVLTATDNIGSGVDWQTLYRVIVDRYANRLELLQHVLNTTSALNIDDRAHIVQTQLRIMLAPYIPLTARPIPISTASSNDSWANPVWQACATKHTSLCCYAHWTRRLASVVTRMWVHGVHAGLDAFISVDATTTPSATVLDNWRMEVQDLMAWLDWSVWVKCRPACGFEEMCYLPTWPWFYNRESPNDAWKRPQPRCIRRFAPYSPLEAA
ncbi:hypothetical protein B0H16DRAFT_1775889 [Mycena metata]|uniref:Uncharacterized protein n=1 Tax=Mycena metata TaxID=1033252 RepID=A0AAD7HVR3_9AGAR|nr:hypothetical protein B0H16DRAFT_1775889 [Mycena metata]